MKRLNEFINEHIVNEANDSTVASSKTFTFKLADLEDTKEVIEKLNNEDSKDGVTVTVEDKTVTVEVTKEGVGNVDGFKSIMADFIKACNNSGHRASSESYAQRLAALEKSMSEIDEYAAAVAGEKEEADAQAEADKKAKEEKEKED